MNSTYPYSVDLYAEADGSSPLETWILQLSAAERRTVAAALRELVAALGQDVCKTEFCKNIGGGLIELRLRQSESQVLKRVGKQPTENHPEDDAQEILLRIFFHPHGQKRALVLHGYSKGRNPSKSHQQVQIGIAEKRLARWKALEKLRLRDEKRPGRG